MIQFFGKLDEEDVIKLACVGVIVMLMVGVGLIVRSEIRQTTASGSAPGSSITIGSRAPVAEISARASGLGFGHGATLAWANETASCPRCGRPWTWIYQGQLVWGDDVPVGPCEVRDGIGGLAFRGCTVCFVEALVHLRETHESPRREPLRIRRASELELGEPCPLTIETGPAAVQSGQGGVIRWRAGAPK